jgi:hypothetical protein
VKQNLFEPAIKQDPSRRLENPKESVVPAPPKNAA